MVMEIRINRFISDEDATLSLVTVANRFVCFGQEACGGRIPAGHYRVTLRREGASHQRYGQRFHDIHKGMLHIMNVPDFKGVLIFCEHPGPGKEGGVMVGSQAKTDPGEVAVTGNVSAYRRFYSLVADAAENKTLTLVIEEHGRQG